MRKDYTVGLNGQGSGVDPDLSLNLAYRCGGELNYNGYCSPEVDKLIDRQSIEADTQKRKKLVWEIERKLAEDGAGRSFFTTAARCAGSPTSRGGRLWSTVSSMAGAWKTCGSTNSRCPPLARPNPQVIKRWGGWLPHGIPARANHTCDLTARN